jgi:hypothetical protein
MGGRLRGVVVRERRREFTVGIDLCEEVVGFLFDPGDCIGSGDPAQGRLGLAGNRDEACASLTGSPGC